MSRWSETRRLTRCVGSLSMRLHSPTRRRSHTTSSSSEPAPGRLVPSLLTGLIRRIMSYLNLYGTPGSPLRSDPKLTAQRSRVRLHRRLLRRGWPAHTRMELDLEGVQVAEPRVPQEPEEPVHRALVLLLQECVPPRRVPHGPNVHQYTVLFSLAGAMISPKFFRKLQYINTLSELAVYVPLTQIDLPAPVYQCVAVSLCGVWY
jgi:hypothetical protein